MSEPKFLLTVTPLDGKQYILHLHYPRLLALVDLTDPLSQINVITIFDTIDKPNAQELATLAREMGEFYLSK